MDAAGVGKTQASRASSRWRSGAGRAQLGTVTRAFVPLKERALPYLPCVVQLSPFRIAPEFPIPDASAVLSSLCPR